MTQRIVDRNVIPQNYGYTPNVSPKPQTLIIVYDQPKVVVVRRYTRIVIPRVDPNEYRKQFDRVLLDTATLLEWSRRLNIPENMITPPMMQ